jgi:prophage antirepressor-like protein
MELVKTFTYETKSYDITLISDPFEPLFKGNDIGNIINLTNIRVNVKNFDDTEKVQKKLNTASGIQKCLFLTEKGINKFLQKYTNQIATNLKEWIVENVKHIQTEYLKDNNDIELIEKIKNKEYNEIEENDTSEKNNYIYIYNIDSRKDVPDLKIGYTTNIKQRIKSYTIICTHGKCELCEVVPHVDIKIVESYIHVLLKNYNIKGEVFQLNIVKAKLIVLNVINLIKIVALDNESQIETKLSKSYDEQCRLLNQQKSIFIESIEKDTKTQPKPSKFDEFIDKFCIVRLDVEVNCKDIIGQYRLWSRNTKKEITMEFKNYLDTRFKYTRLRNQGKDQSVYGYTGVTLIEIEHKRSLNPTDLEMFVFEKCVFSQGGTILKSTLVENYIDWKKNVGREITKEDESAIVDYFKNGEYSDHVLYSTVWTKEGSGQGYYGLILKSDIKYYKKPSTTSKQVFKRLLKTNFLLTKWDTIAKAAESENVSNAKMSRYIKNKTEVNDYYYTLE